MSCHSKLCEWCLQLTLQEIEDLYQALALLCEGCRSDAPEGAQENRAMLDWHMQRPYAS